MLNQLINSLDSRLRRERENSFSYLVVCASCLNDNPLLSLFIWLYFWYPRLQLWLELRQLSNRCAQLQTKNSDRSVNNIQLPQKRSTNSLNESDLCVAWFPNGAHPSCIIVLSQHKSPLLWQLCKDLLSCAYMQWRDYVAQVSNELAAVLK